MSRMLSLVVPDPDNPPDWCFRLSADGQLPTCTLIDGQWHRSYDSDPGLGSSAGDGIPAAMGALFVLALLASIGVLVWKVSTARRMARESGMNPDDATVMTVLTDDGFEATYLAANLRQHPAPPAPAGPATASAAERLRELDRLLAEGLITQAERDERRRAVIDTI